ncbi:hypothetical protein [Vreelandella nanhaiensis]|uniref:Uncharacterized protein n=1 Tax=Vreelandella nanhaiensis TaxID=1258546 RepID=A0A3S0Y9F4_9GAMM|nr:hypothetical protein [Halomonas nanhaiensis]RUR33622.1 hypothetical protein ELY38_04135 [Halomonas nanhaiensis]
MPNTNVAQKRLLRFALATLISVLFIIAVWLMGSHWLLNSQWLPNRISQFEGIEIRWSQGSSRHPGRWKVENLYLTREDDALPITIEAERATLHLSLLSLLHGELHINAMDAKGIRRLTVGDIALEAQGTLEVVDTTLSREHLTVPKVNLAITEGRLVRLSDQTTLVNEINLEAAASLDEVTPTDPATSELNSELLAALSATLEIQAQADAWDVFMPYLEALPWLFLNGRGALNGHIELALGTLEPGSQLVLNAPELHLTLDERRLNKPEHPPTWIIADTPPPRHTATGKGSVTLGVNEDRLEFETQLTDVTLADTQPYAVNTELSLTSSVANQRLDHLASPTDTELTLEGTITRLDMLDRYLADTLQGEGVRLSGNGRIAADVSVRDTQAHNGHLWIEAENLAAKALDFTVQGNGTLNAELRDAATLNATLDFSSATLSHFEQTLLDSAIFNLTAQSPIDPIKAREQANATLSWDDARLPNINALQPYINTYLPDPAPLRLISGQAQSQGTLNVTHDQLSGEVQLAGNALTTRWQRSDQHTTLTSDMQLSLLLNQAATDGTSLDISGSRLHWQVADNMQPGERLESILVLREGRFQRRADTPSGQFQLEGSVQRLGFLNTFLPAAHGVSLSGNGQLFAQGSFRDDRLLAPTRLRINANQLEVVFLDYLVTGRGELTAQIDSTEQAQLSLGIPQFSLQRKDDERPHVEGRHFALTTQTDQLSKVLATPAPEYFVTRIALPITEVPDFTRYNRYLPESAGITLLGGQASLASEWLLDGLKAQGQLSLRAFGADMALLDQRLRGDLHLSLILTDGDLETHRFTADNSFLRLENIIRPNEGISADAGWWVQFSMNNAQLDWTDPVHLVSQVGLEMRDTGLLARLFLERARAKEWLGRLLSVRNISGSAELVINGERASLKDLVLTGGPLLLLSDINLAERRADGALYARLGALGMAVELEDSQPNLHLFRPRRWFDHWRQTQSSTLDAPPPR